MGSADCVLRDPASHTQCQQQCFHMSLYQPHGICHHISISVCKCVDICAMNTFYWNSVGCAFIIRYLNCFWQRSQGTSNSSGRPPCPSHSEISFGWKAWGNDWSQSVSGYAAWAFLLLLRWLEAPLPDEEARQDELECVSRSWVLLLGISREEKASLEWESLKQQKQWNLFKWHIRQFYITEWWDLLRHPNFTPFPSCNVHLELLTISSLVSKVLSQPYFIWTSRICVCVFVCVSF